MTGEATGAGDRLRGLAGGPVQAAISLGSGLSPVARHLGLHVLATFAELGLHSAGVAGHTGQVSAGRIGDSLVVAFEGRLHLYEGYSLWDATAWVRLAHAAGARQFVLTNAAGGLNPGFAAGDIMLITDQLSLPGLVGYTGAAGTGSERYPWPRFLGHDNLYDPGMAAAVRLAAIRLQQPLREGVYCMVHGPSYESPAERRFLRALGADAVGMSTAPEATTAFGLGGSVLGLSVITNVADAPEPPTHEEVTRMSLESSQKLAALLRESIPLLPPPKGG